MTREEDEEFFAMTALVFSRPKYPSLALSTRVGSKTGPYPTVTGRALEFERFAIHVEDCGRPEAGYDGTIRDLYARYVRWYDENEKAHT